MIQDALSPPLTPKRIRRRSRPARVKSWNPGFSFLAFRESYSSIAMTENTSITPFQQKVYAACQRIPRGRVSTYRWLGEAIDCKSARAIGQALKRNPFAPEVPCHRVVRSDRSLGGFAGQKEGEEVRRKRRMLEAEGISFGNDERVDASALMRLARLD